jgi:hypothetical protein
MSLLLGFIHPYYYDIFYRFNTVCYIRSSYLYLKGINYYSIKMPLIEYNLDFNIDTT